MNVKAAALRRAALERLAQQCDIPIELLDSIPPEHFHWKTAMDVKYPPVDDTTMTDLTSLRQQWMSPGNYPRGV